MVYHFGPFRLDGAERRLQCAQRAVPLTPKALDTLLVLVANAGRAVGKDELMEKVWPGTSVEEATLACRHPLDLRTAAHRPSSLSSAVALSRISLGRATGSQQQAHYGT